MDVIISLDLSVNCSGIAVLSTKGVLLEAAKVEPTKNREKFPKGTVLKALSMGKQIAAIIKRVAAEHTIQRIVIEEIAVHRSIMTAKVLSFVHAFVFQEILDYLDIVEVMSAGEWRSKKGVNVYIRKKGDRTNNYKQPIIDYVNNRYGTSYTVEDNDIADAIALGTAYLIISQK